MQWIWFRSKDFSLYRFSTSNFFFNLVSPFFNKNPSSCHSKLASAGKLDQAEVNAEIDAAKARLGATGDMKAFPTLEFSDPDFSTVVDFKLQ